MLFDLEHRDVKRELRNLMRTKDLKNYIDAVNFIFKDKDVEFRNKDMR